MFSDKKKKSKGWLLIIPLCLIFAAGIWLNGYLDDNVDSNNGQDTAVSSQYEGEDLSNTKDTTDPQTDVENQQDKNKVPTFQSGEEEKNLLEDYFMIVSEDGFVVVKEYVDGVLQSQMYTEIDAESLPPYDRAALKTGMVMLTQDEVDSLMENFEG